jgi:hypothetical protein
MENKETLEEFAEKVARAFDNDNYKALMDLVIAGAKWQQEQMFDIMQQYAAFCVKCDREKLPLLFAKDWFEQFKKEIKWK